jgi:hypothetical protein
MRVIKHAGQPEGTKPTIDIMYEVIVYERPDGSLAAD